MSVQLFLLCAELIAIELRKCENIEGIPVEDIIMLLNQYADDMDISSLFKQESLNAIMDKLEWFNKRSGFTLNSDKTHIFRIGALKDSEAKLYTQKGIAWTSDYISVLGVHINHKNLQPNYQMLLPRINTTLKSWQNRNLSLFGKINVVNTLIVSLFVYKDNGAAANQW